MATISTDTYLDGGTARTAGETWTINSGAKLIIRTDTRWHANAPASMTGTLGNITTNAGGMSILGTSVRWMPFDTGSGTVPAIGTSITQGGVSGYLLGVWSGLDQAPTAVGASMPATGWIKFREVTGGAFSSGALTGISANATGPDVVGWIEVVFDQGALIGGAFNGFGLVSQGAWFDLGTTSGSRGQVVQLPTNGGGSNTYVLGVQIETAPSSGVYEWWPCIDSANWLTTQVATDARAKYVECPGNGQIRIGANASATSIGHLPAAGCKIRTPNVFMRQATSAARATNILTSSTNSSRAVFQTAGYFELNTTSCDYRVVTTVAPKQARLTNSVFETYVQFSGCNDLVITSCAVGSVNTTSGTPVSFTGCNNLQINGLKALRRGAGTSVLYSYLSNASVQNHESAFVATTMQSVISISGVANSTFSNLLTRGGGVSVASSKNITIDGHDYIERLFGDTTNAGNQRCFIFNDCTNLTYKNLTFGLGGTLSNCHPFSSLFASGGGNTGVKIRSVGSAAAPLSVGSNSALFPSSVITGTSANADSDVSVQRVYLAGTRNGLTEASASGVGTTDYLYEHVYGTGSVTVAGAGALIQDSLYRSVRAAYTTALQASGTSFLDLFTSDTVGQICFQVGQPTTWSSTYVSASFNGSNLNAGFQTPTGIIMPTVGDYITMEFPYTILGHTSFQNTTATITGTNTGNFTYQYQIDTGSGWNGTWKTISGANLSAESTSAAGFKLKIKVTTSVASNTNQFNNIRLATNSTATAQQNNLYPLDTATLTLTGLVAGSEVRAYTGSDPATAVEIAGVESSGTSFSFSHSAGGSVGYIRVFALGYQPYNYDPYTYSASDTTLLVQQVVDRNYVNP